jgi:hypothetical protein
LTYNAQIVATTSTTAIVGLPAAENIVSMITDQLPVSCMRLVHPSRIYFINEKSGVATAVGSTIFFTSNCRQTLLLDFNNG